MLVVSAITAGVVAVVLCSLGALLLRPLIQDLSRPLELRAFLSGAVTGVSMAAGFAAHFIVLHRPVEWGGVLVIGLMTGAVRWLKFRNSAASAEKLVA